MLKQKNNPKHKPFLTYNAKNTQYQQTHTKTNTTLKNTIPPPKKQDWNKHNTKHNSIIKTHNTNTTHNTKQAHYNQTQE